MSIDTSKLVLLCAALGVLLVLSIVGVLLVVEAFMRNPLPTLAFLLIFLPTIMLAVLLINFRSVLLVIRKIARNTRQKMTNQEEEIFLLWVKVIGWIALVLAIVTAFVLFSRAV